MAKLRKIVRFIKSCFNAYIELEVEYQKWFHDEIVKAIEEKNYDRLFWLCQMQNERLGYGNPYRPTPFL